MPNGHVEWFGFGSYPARVQRVWTATRVEMVIDLGFRQVVTYPFHLAGVAAPLPNDPSPVARSRAMAARIFVCDWLAHGDPGAWPFRLVSIMTPQDHVKDRGLWQARIYRMRPDGGEECLNEALLEAGHAVDPKVGGQADPGAQ